MPRVARCLRTITVTNWVNYKFTGSDALSAKFKELSAGIRKQVVLPAALDAMEIVRDDAKNRADRIDDPETRQYIPKNITMSENTRLSEELDCVAVSVGVKRGRKGSGNNTFYWWWVETGTSRIRPQPFMRNALSQNRNAVFKEFLSSAKYQLIKLGVN